MADADTAQKPETTGDLKGQAELFGRKASLRQRRIELRAESPVIEADDAQVEKRFGAGRPPGAKNVATLKRLELFQRIAGDPLLQAARVLAMSLEDLAAKLGCRPFEAAIFQQKVWSDVMPYVMSKAPVDLNVNKRSTALHLHFPVTPGARPGGAVGALALLQQAEAEVGGTVIEGVFEEEDENAAIPTA